MELLTILHNKIFLSVLIATVGAQIIKYLLHKDEPLLRGIFASGGMPSSHAAAVIALATGIYLTEGVSSLFVMSILFAIIVMVDASGVRYATGLNAIRINRLVSVVHKKFKIHIKKAEVLMGHTYMQVLVGAILGWLVTMIVFSF